MQVKPLRAGADYSDRRTAAVLANLFSHEPWRDYYLNLESRYLGLERSSCRTTRARD